MIEAPQGLAVPLANYSERRIARLTVTVRDVPSFHDLCSVKRGPLRYRRAGKDITVTPPVDWGDMLVIRR